ncbi:unnamed protein product [Paramecium sonneborni]|uniref:Proliferating cell nuclear antigen n=1 Tax=Paramecium sonneborni TaxID=65129 RepID=A0A8S1QPI0_9CILI|nr:unnamed protein product [Paramecium sonneborni]
MFEAKFKNGLLFKRLIDVFKEMVISANLECDETGILLQGMDIKYSCMLTLRISLNGFLKYICDKQIKIRLKIQNFQTILKCSENEDQITLKSQYEDPKTLSIIFESKKRISEFQLNLLNNDEEQFGIPFFEHNSIIKMPSIEFIKICRELANINEYINIETEQDKIKFSVKGEIILGHIQMNTFYSFRPEERVICEVIEPVNLMFEVKFLNQFNVASTLFNSITLLLSQDLPLVVEHLIEDIAILRLYLAPKIIEEQV